jgi:hypothetical protein
MRDLAIRNTHPTVVTILGEVEAWDANGDVVALDETLIQAEIARLQAEYDALEYSRSRKAEYPSIEECIHAILDDDLTALQVKRQAVKDKYPKGGN